MQLSPFERFRRARNCLSVTDLVSPLWCQSQYQYALEKGGRNRRTPAMKKGHEIHAELENEVHIAVEFIVEKDERRPLQMLRILCGLLELESQGITRELPVFGFVDDILVTGVVDELYIIQDSPPQLPQQTNMDKVLTHQKPSARKIILMDSKTRVSATEPSTSQMDQVKLQLIIYWQFLHSMPEFNIESFYLNEGLNGQTPFSDQFLAQAVELVESYSDTIGDEILAKHNLDGLWSLLRKQILCMRHNLTDKVRVRYIHQESRKIISERNFVVDQEWAFAQRNRILQWWKGEREAEGIEVEEAFKCRICDFEEGCSWRLGKIQAGIDLKRRRKEAEATAFAKAAAKQVRVPRNQIHETFEPES